MYVGICRTQNNNNKIIIIFKTAYTRYTGASFLAYTHLCFYPRDAMLERVIEIARVCLSVCPSRAGIVSKRRKLAA